MFIYNLKRTLALSLILGLAFSFQSCKKADEIVAEQQTAQQYSQTESDVNKSQDATDLIASQIGSAKTDAINLWYLPAGTVITIDSTSATRSITIDFGTSGLVCSNWDGRTRAGKIITTWTGKYRDQGTVKTTTTDGYRVNGKLHTLTRTVTNLGTVSGYISFSILANATVETDNGNFTYASTRTRRWIAGSSTQDPADDVYNVFGTANGSHPNGSSFIVTVLEATPLRMQLNCYPRHITGGTAEFSLTRSGSTNAFSIDYGNGTCNSLAYLNRQGRRWLLLFY
jgi:hypothetical protein